MGRPRKNNGLQAAQADNLSLDQPSGAAENSEFSTPAAGFFKRWQEHPNRDAISCYLYRLWPRIDRKRAGFAFNYIDKIAGSETLTAETILKKWGRGTYQMRLHDALAGPSGRQMAVSKLVLDDPDYEPAFESLKEIDIGHPDNRSFVQTLKLKGLLTEGGEMPNETAAASAVEKLTHTVTDLAGKLADRGNPQAGDALSQALALVRELQPKGDILDQAAKLKALAGDNTAVFQMMMEQQSRMMEILAKVQAPAAAPAAPASLLDQLDTLTAVMDKLGGLRAPARSDGGGVVSELVRNLPSLLASGAQMLQYAAVLRSAPAAAPGGALVPPAAPGGPALPPGAVPGDGVVVNPSEAEFMGVSPMRMLEVGRRALSAFRRGVSGSAFADGLVNTEDDGEKLYEMLASMAPDELLAVLQQTPFWGELAGQVDQVRAWLVDFIAYGQGDESDQAPAGGQEGAAA